MMFVSINSEVKHPRPSKRIVDPPYVSASLVSINQLVDKNKL